jgi:hypothetical protein
MKKYIILLLLVGFILPLKAQFVKNQGAKVTIVAGSYVKSGEWTNTNATSETNLNGELNLTQNLVNNGVFTGTTSSLLSFTGTNLQNVQGSTPISLFNMQINKAFSNVNLQNSVTISNLLSLTSGRLISEVAPIIFTPTASNPVETNTNRIIGTATMQTRVIGTSSFPTFLGFSLAAGTDIGSLSLSRATGNQGVVTIPPERSIACTWTLNATNNVSRDITYSWLSDLDNGADLTALQPRQSTTSTWSPIGVIDDLSTRTYTVTNQLNGEWSLFGLIPPSNPTLPTPASPTNFVATAISTTQINLSWNPVTSNATEYQIFQDAVSIAILPIATTTFQVIGLNPNTLYNFQIVAVNRAGGQALSSSPSSARDWTFPESPVLISIQEVCVEGRATLRVNSSGSIYRVYDQLTGGTLLLESNNGSFELPFTNQTTIFYVSVLGAGGDESARLAVSVRIADAFEAVIVGENTQSSCENTLPLQAQVVEGVSLYQWYLNDQFISEGQTLTARTTGFYKLLVKKGNCTVFSNPVLVRLNQTPIARIREQNGVRFCDNGTINAVEVGTGATYEWLLNTTTVGQGTNVSVSQSGTYTLQVTQNGCQASTQIEVLVTPIPQIPVLVATESTICPTTETTISVQNTANGINYEWFRNGRRIRQTGSFLTTSVQGNYQVRAIADANLSCSVFSTELRINRFDVETIYLRISENKTTLFLENLAGSQDGITSVEWYFEGEANAALGTTSTIIPTEDGNYSARVTNQNGCIVQTRTVYFSIVKPTLITGEEDLKTDVFIIYPNPSKGIFTIRFGSALVEDTQISIFDATGKVIRTQIFEKGNQEFKIDIQKLAKGMYLIRFNQNNIVYSKSIITE